ncbi:HlyD family efflux transporter periplasmic adaptor subunit [Dehalobacter sp. TeCB1]|uniref:HlyD family efflux transporter periplasmic adaptor subunit n=1 Tax=Dehalobacter sp. TeCB1 TaxID=1843715 RepID=UPI0009F1986D|nr:HlyD family efflux transporter periplasmic adaptor subunit [Dehalobacter sp. TeCB1]
MQLNFKPLKTNADRQMPDSKPDKKGIRLSIDRLKKIRKRTWIIIGVVIVAMIAAKVFLFKSNTTAAANITIKTATVIKGTVQQMVTATGTAEFSQSMPLSFEVSGTIQEIYVKTGDVVKKGDPLASLDTTTLEQQLKEAQENYASAQANYSQTLGDLGRKLKSSLVSAESSLLTAQQKADPNYLENQYYLAELNVKEASQKLAEAQGSGETDTYQLQAALSQAQLALADALNKKNGGAAKDLEVAKDQYEAAKEAVSDYEKGAGSDYLSAKAALTKSQTDLMTTQQNLDDAILKAPEDGTIVSCSVDPYQTVNSQSTVMILVSNPQNFKVSASVDQTEITELKVGQKASLTLDTDANTVIDGTVETVSLAGTNNQNVVTYGITIKVDKLSDILRDQMSVNVSIVTDEAKDVLIIPSEAVITRNGVTGVLVPTDQASSQGTSKNTTSGLQNNASLGSQNAAQGSSQMPSGPRNGNNTSSNRSSMPSNTTGSSTGNKSAGTSGNYKFVQITIGLDDGTNVEVKSGLTEGQTVIIRTVTATSTSSTSSSSSSSSKSYRSQGMGGLGSLTGGGNGGPPSGGPGQ